MPKKGMPKKGGRGLFYCKEKKHLLQKNKTSWPKNPNTKLNSDM